MRCARRAAILLRKRSAVIHVWFGVWDPTPLCVVEASRILDLPFTSARSRRHAADLDARENLLVCSPQSTCAQMLSYGPDVGRRPANTPGDKVQNIFSAVCDAAANADVLGSLGPERTPVGQSFRAYTQHVRNVASGQETLIVVGQDTGDCRAK